MPINSKKKIQGIYYPPGDKSISHRSLILTGQAVGKSEITNLLEGEDVINTLLVMRELGARITKKNGKYIVFGTTPWRSFSTQEAIRFW
jgi:3-phosphoshikimate 1-carboxyvinyltransferase